MIDRHVSYDMEMTVNWGDCDAAGISYYAKNFEWYTNSYMQLLAHYRFPYMETFHNHGINLVCLKADSTYKKMVRPLENIIVRSSITLLARTRMEFAYQIIKENGEIAAEGYTSHAYVNNEGVPMNLEKSFPTLWGKLSNLGKQR
ncbi:acyl-CoA thioesterase [Oceanobacillus damuensis]|uniref:acyl-CoA thioesterase n=1 Tax=Oceanobacillus damuensis TaxID=937928 RepID=UPI00082BA8B3|nr:acyl-CoA thioesterase [Oceanobacillus damuensis]